MDLRSEVLGAEHNLQREPSRMEGMKGLLLPHMV